jgi:hypothetical protein
VRGGNPANGDIVEFFDGATSLGTSSLTGGTATITLSSLNAGTHNIVAKYAGNATLDESSSDPLSFTVAKRTPLSTGVILQT